MSLIGFLRAGDFTVSLLSGFDAASHVTSQDITTDSNENQRLVLLHFEQSNKDPSLQC